VMVMQAETTGGACERQDSDDDEPLSQYGTCSAQLMVVAEQ
jgi:hypothetical protein